MRYLSVVTLFTLAVFLLTLPVPGHAQTWFQDNFFDEDDGKLDVSNWLAKGGFFPVPIIITEPAVEAGLGFAFAWIYGGDPVNKSPPNTTGLAALGTGNGSEAYAAFHRGYYFDDRLRVNGVVADTSLNLNFFSDVVPGGFRYNFDGVYASAAATTRVRDSNWFAGGRYTYFDADVRYRGAGNAPGDLPTAPVNARLSGLGAILDYDTLDNSLTPNDGTSARLSATVYDKALGSNFDYTAAGLSIFSWKTPNPTWTHGVKFEVEATSDDAPFFVRPFISLRGIPVARYQSDAVVSTEVETFYRLNDRWRATAFGGVGYAGDDPKFTVGAGFRYRIARKLGLDAGIDIAQGPEDTVLYIQFGTAWQRF